MSGLVELARRFVALSDELEAIRGEIRMAVLNGVGPAGNPPQPVGGAGGREPAAKQYPDRETIRAMSAQQDEAVMELLKSQPGLRTAEIARAIGGNKSTLQQRLQRLSSRGQVQRDDNGAWAVAASAAA
jgi:hypothetical protein